MGTAAGVGTAAEAGAAAGVGTADNVGTAAGVHISRRSLYASLGSAAVDSRAIHCVRKLSTDGYRKWAEYDLLARWKSSYESQYTALLC